MTLCNNFQQKWRVGVISGVGIFLRDYSIPSRKECQKRGECSFLHLCIKQCLGHSGYTWPNVYGTKYSIRAFTTINNDETTGIYCPWPDKLVKNYRQNYKCAVFATILTSFNHVLQTPKAILHKTDGHSFE